MQMLVNLLFSRKHGVVTLLTASSGILLARGLLAARATAEDQYMDGRGSARTKAAAAAVQQQQATSGGSTPNKRVAMAAHRQERERGGGDAASGPGSPRR